YDLHVNVVGGGNIDGPSAGLAIFFALYSALTKTRLVQDIALTGELSIQGKVRPVGGILEKIYAARQAGMRVMIIPKENEREIASVQHGIEVIAVSTVDDVLEAFDLPAVRNAGAGATARPVRRRPASAR
ncbi:MAG TPA: S16 family serine protease, partial [Candidatus Baltobacteraceae bacterium]